MSREHFFTLFSIVLLGCSSQNIHAVSSTTQLKIGVVIKADAKCDFNYSLEDNNSIVNQNSHNSACQISKESIKKDLVSTVKINNDDNQRYRVMMTVQ